MSDSSISQEFIKNAVRGRIIDNQTSPPLYEYIKNQAKDMGMDIEKEGIKIIIVSHKDLPHADAAVLFGKKTILLRDDLFRKDTEADTLDALIEMDKFTRTIRHEVQHCIDEKNGFYDGLLDPNARRASDGYYSQVKKIGECRANFVSPNNTLSAVNFLLSAEHNLPNEWPSFTEAYTSLFLQDYIRNKTGKVLKVGDVKFNEKCEFSITNKDILHDIPPEVLLAADNAAKEFMGMCGKGVGDNKTPPVKSIPKSQQEQKQR